MGSTLALVLMRRLAVIDADGHDYKTALRAMASSTGDDAASS